MVLCMASVCLIMGPQKTGSLRSDRGVGLRGGEENVSRRCSLCHFCPSLASSALHGLCTPAVSCRHTCGCCQSFPFKGREAFPEGWWGKRETGGQKGGHICLEDKPRTKAQSRAFQEGSASPRMERAILPWPWCPGHVLSGGGNVQRMSSWVWASRTHPSQQSPPYPGPPLSKESGFNFLVSEKRRRKRTRRRRRRKERVEVLMRSAGICHSAHSPLTTQGSPSCKQPMIYGHRVNSCGRNQP